MLTIRNEQFQVFEEKSVDRFKDEMVEEVSDAYPDACSDLSEDEIKDIIQYGIETASSYDITTDNLVSDYIHLMFTHGIDFDQDSEYPWAQEILNDESLSEAETMKKLLEHVDLEETDENQELNKEDAVTDV